ncbi:MAG: DUF4007 family protein [Caldilineaceae bacterium]|nr:DUF4007 family protein [Caldilineaceae bacterium]
MKLSYTFSGHESFPCRQFWLKKGYDFVRAGGHFSSNDAIVRLGVGKNMVASIQYWMRAFGLMDADGNLTQLAHALLADDGYDPYLEDIGTLWLLHYLLLVTEHASIYSLVFNELRKQRIDFTRKQVIDFLDRTNRETGINVSPKTLRTDVDVLIRTYLSVTGRTTNPEDDFVALLIDLYLVQRMERANEAGETVYRIESKDRDALPTEVLLFALLHQNRGDSFSFAQLMAGPNNVGNIFALTRNGLQRHIDRVVSSTPDVVFTDNAGIRELQFIRRPDPMVVLEGYYQNAQVFAFS